MSTYIKSGKPLEFDNAPDWLVRYMLYRLTILGNTEATVMTFFKNLREFCQWASYYKHHGRNPSSEDALRKIDLLSLPLDVILAITKNDVETYLHFLANNIKNTEATRNKKLAAISGLYEYLLDQQHDLGICISVNPAERIRRPKLPSKQPIYLTEKDCTALLDAIDGENAVRDYCIFLLMLTAGLRISEVVMLDLQDINFEYREMRIHHGKGKKERIAYLTVPCCDAVQYYLDTYRNLVQPLKTDALFVSRRRKERLTARALQQAMYKYTLTAKLGGKGYTPHKLRHTAATFLAKEGVDLLVIQKMLGHESANTTKIYTHLDSSDIAAAVSASKLETFGG